MRRAELVTAVIMAAFSAYLMWKSAELPIGWVKSKGPGGGAFPFWLALIMLLASVAIFVRGWRRPTPVSQSDEAFIDREGLTLFALTAGSIFGMMLLTQYMGAYVAILLFMFFYMKVMGRHGWALTTLISVAMPVGIFFLFEIGMKIFLPKGITEPLFYPLYRIFL